MFLRLDVVGVCVLEFVMVEGEGEGVIKGFLFSIVNYILYVLCIIIIGNNPMKIY